MRRRMFLKFLGLKLFGLVFPLVVLGPYGPLCPFGSVVSAHAARAARSARSTMEIKETTETAGHAGKTGDRRTMLFRLRRERLVRDIRRVLGRPYRWGAAGPGAFDCSGLIYWLYARAGIRIPRTARQQGSVGIRVQANPVFGDVLLFRSQASPTGWHTGLYLGQDYFVHAAGRTKGVIVSPLAGYRRRLVSVRRYLVEHGAA